jgi:flagellar biosynthesis protein FlhB
MASQGEKTQKATPHRLQKSRREGQFPVSRDLISALQFCTFFVLSLELFSRTASSTKNLVRTLIEAATSVPDLNALAFHSVYAHTILPFFLNLLLPGLGLAAAAILIQLFTTRFGIATKQLMPDIKRLNSFSRIKQMPQDNLVNSTRSVVLMCIIFFLVYSLIRQQIGELTNLAGSSLSVGIVSAATLLKRLMRELAFVLLIFGFIDYFWQRSKFNKNMRMTKQEVKEEAKTTEGNTEMKMRIRRLQRAAVRRNMIKAVEKASVVITNPTRYAIAIHYQMGTRTVPVVVAKGKNYLAKIIRERAKEHDVPIVENKPLAQALYQAVDIGNEIPSALYRAVAEVLGQIYRILNRP